MMQKVEPIEYGHFYHIYNHGVGSRDIFRETANYEHFLQLYDKYISPVAETYAWVLMRNHFHLLVRIKEKDEMGNYKALNDLSEREAPDSVERKRIINSDRPGDAVRFQTTNDPKEIASGILKIPNPSRHFSHLFNAYSRYFNIRHQTTGGLFERPFKRKRMNNEKYLRQVILYIHNNPVHHGFCKHPSDYPWSSYLTCISVKPTKLQRSAVIGWFDDEANFKYVHQKRIDIIEIEKWLELKK